MSEVPFWDKTHFTDFNNSQVEESLDFSYDSSTNLRWRNWKIEDLGNDNNDGPLIFDEEIEEIFDLDNEKSNNVPVSRN